MRPRNGSRGSVEARHRIEQRRSHGMGGFAPARQYFAPPLKADLAERRLGDELPHAGDLEAEGVKRVHMRPKTRRQE